MTTTLALDSVAAFFNDASNLEFVYREETLIAEMCMCIDGFPSISKEQKVCETLRRQVSVQRFCIVFRPIFLRLSNLFYGMPNEY